jgi:hypothetical protein
MFNTTLTDYSRDGSTLPLELCIIGSFLAIIFCVSICFKKSPPPPNNNDDDGPFVAVAMQT